MNREVKVRAWNTEAHDWVEGLTLTIHTSGRLLHIPEHIILTWFTGLVDKHGKDIYQDDIIKADWHWEGPHRVIWPDDHYGITEYGLDSNFDIEVIGNVWETPELLQKAGNA